MNLNDFAAVVLTESGADILNERNKENTRLFPMYNIEWKTDYKEGDIHADILWSLLDTFAEYYHSEADAPYPFTDLKKIE